MHIATYSEKLKTCDNMIFLLTFYIITFLGVAYNDFVRSLNTGNL